MSSHRKILNTFSLKRIMIPVILGLSAAFILVYISFDRQAFLHISWSSQMMFWLSIALVLMVIRDLAYMYRLRLLTNKELNWKKSFQVIMLWEFASSVTPSVVGGSAVALFIVHKEGINIGRTTAIVMTTALLDELFYILAVPFIFVFIGSRQIFDMDANFALFNTVFGSQGIFLIGYFFILLLTGIIIFGIFVNPRGLKMLLLAIFKIPFLRKYREGVRQTGDDIISTSVEMKNKSFAFWMKAYFSTVFSWTARFGVVNCLIMAFSSGHDHLLIFARQLVMWVILLISPTPGGSGVAEFVFSDFLGQFIPAGISPALALLWRIISYYPYLIVGAIVLPIWLRRIYLKRKLIRFKGKTNRKTSLKRN